MFLSSARRLYIQCRSKLYFKEAKVKFSSVGKIFGVQEPWCPTVKTNHFRWTKEDIRAGHTMAQNAWLSVEDENRELMALWPDIVRDLTDSYPDISDVTKWLKKVLEYNVLGGNPTKAISLINAYLMMAPPEELTEENIRLARIVAWSLELPYACSLMIDDIQDRSQIRKKRPCWYLHDDIGLAAITDGLLLESAGYQLLRTRLKGKDCYIEVVELLQESINLTLMGQCLDLLSSNFCGKINLNLFTEERYNNLVKYKTACYDYLLPIRAAMYLAGLRDPEMHSQIKPILFDMGHYSQVKNDFLDCYGDPSVTGKDGTDIQGGKCTWLIMVALQRATPEQRKILDNCYGSKDPEKIELVKRVYDEMGLSNSYWIYEKKTCDLLASRIKQLSCGLPNDFFLDFLERIRSWQ